MKIAGFKRIVKENVPQEYRELVDVIGNNINLFAEDVLNAMNKNLTVEDNLKMEYKDLEVTVNSSGIPINTTQYKTVLLGKLKGISIEKAENLTNTNTYPNSAPFVTFSQDNQIITILHITGLPANNKYKLTLLTKG